MVRKSTWNCHLCLLKCWGNYLHLVCWCSQAEGIVIPWLHVCLNKKPLRRSLPNFTGGHLLIKPHKRYKKTKIITVTPIHQINEEEDSLCRCWCSVWYSRVLLMVHRVAAQWIPQFIQKHHQHTVCVMFGRLQLLKLPCYNYTGNSFTT